MPGTRSELFPDHFFPQFQQGESLYSWCARIHRLSCNQSPHQTSFQLFGDKKSGMRCDFPTPLETLKDRTGDFLDFERDILREKTLFGFYEKFLPELRRNALAEAINIGPFSRVHYALGLSASLSKIRRNLRCCRICLDDVGADESCGWWKMEEQWPANFLCYKHDHLLDSLGEESRQRLNEDWILPSAPLLRKSHQAGDLSPLLLTRLKNVSDWCFNLLSAHELDLETPVLRYCYLLRAKQRGLLAMNGEIRLSSMRDEWLSWAGDLPFLPDLEFTRDVSGVNAGFIGQLVRAYPGVRHPLKHFLLIAHLFESFSDLKDANDLVTRMLREEGEEGMKNHLSNLRSHLRNLVLEEKLSVNAAAADIGIGVSQATKYLRSAGVAYKKRPRIVGTKKEKLLVEYLQRGASRIEIADSVGIRMAFLKDYLAKNPDLRAVYLSICLEKRRKEYRQRFVDVVKENSLMPLKRIKAIPGNGYQWLRRNDSEWLADALPSLWETI